MGRLLFLNHHHLKSLYQLLNVIDLLIKLHKASSLEILVVQETFSTAYSVYNACSMADNGVSLITEACIPQPPDPVPLQSSPIDVIDLTEVNDTVPTAPAQLHNLVQVKEEPTEDDEPTKLPSKSNLTIKQEDDGAPLFVHPYEKGQVIILDSDDEILDTSPDDPQLEPNSAAISSIPAGQNCDDHPKESPVSRNEPSTPPTALDKSQSTSNDTQSPSRDYQEGPDNSPVIPAISITRTLLKNPKSPQNKRAMENKVAAEKMEALRKKHMESLLKMASSNTKSALTESPIQESSPTDTDNANFIEDESYDIQEDHQEAAKDFEAFKANYQKRKSHNQTTLADDVKYIAAENAEHRRYKRLSNLQALEHQESPALQESTVFQEADSIFFPDDNSSAKSTKRSSSPTSSTTAQPTKRTKTDKPKYSVAGSIPISDIRASQALGFEASESNRKKTSKRSVSSKRGNKPPGQDASLATERGKKRRPKPKGPVLSNVQSLYTSNFISDAQAGSSNANKLAQPGFSAATGRNRDKALKELLASIPAEEKKTASIDKKALYKSCQSFSGRRCQPDGAGGWRVSGMKSSLKHFQLLAAAFMRDRENSNERPFGGLLADVMVVPQF